MLIYEFCKKDMFYNAALDIWELYLNKGMTATFANFNWFERFDTWTEPCAIVDSFILALQFYKITGNERDLRMARRIWHNAMASSQRPNGGAGTDTCVTGNMPVLKAGDIYEAFFCCTMRLSEWACFGLMRRLNFLKYKVRAIYVRRFALLRNPKRL